MSPRTARIPRIDAAFLARHPLPDVRKDADKEARGRVLVIGGSRLVPGALLLSGMAALRGGAGKLQMATIRDAALILGVTVPEALVIPLPETGDGEIGSVSSMLLAATISEADAVLVGPGMMSSASAQRIVQRVIPLMGRRSVLVLDGAAIATLAVLDPMPRCPLILTPNVREMAQLLGVSRETVERTPAAKAEKASTQYGAVVALKNAATWVATPGRPSRCCDRGHVGLATSGSGDVLAGLVSGLAARGAPAFDAAMWGVYLHAKAGSRLAREQQGIGFIARELLPVIPQLLS